MHKNIKIKIKHSIMNKFLQSFSRAGFTAILSFTCLFSLSAATGIHKSGADEVDGDIIFFEDFSGCTAALNDSVPLRNSSTAMLDPEMLGEEGWWGGFAYCSSGAVALAYPNYGGFITTPSMNLYGRVTVSFRYKVREGNKGMSNFWVHVYRGNPAVNEPVIDLNESSRSVVYMSNECEKGWQDFSLSFDNPYDGDDVFVQINAQFLPVAGIEIDDLKISRVVDFVTAPTSVRVTEVTDDGFKMAWNPGAENKSYKVNCIEQKVLSDQPESYSENFAGDSMPENWEGDGNIAKGAGFEDQDAVELSLNQTLYAPVNFSTVKGLVFSVRPEGLTDMYGMSVVKILGLTEEGTWEAPSEIMLLLVPAEGMVIDIAEQAPSFLDKYVGFGFNFYNYLDSESGKVLISDVKWITDGSKERKALLHEESVSEPFISVENVDPDASHFIQVAGVNGKLISDYTAMTKVIGVAAPNNLKTDNLSKENLSYTAEWDNVTKADAGYVVRNFIVTKPSESIEGYTVMDESFTTDLQGVAYVEDRTLDAFTDIPGWTVESKPDAIGYAKVGGGQLGADGRAILVSPEMSLTNNDGTFTLEFKLAGHGNVALDVTAGNETQTIVLPGEYDWENDAEVYAEKNFSLTFHSGTPNSRLRFTSSNWHAFMLSNIKVKQNIPKDEYIYRLLGKFNAEAGVTSIDIDNKDFGYGLYAFGVQSLMGNSEAGSYESKVVLSPVVDFESGLDVKTFDMEVSAGVTGKTLWIYLPINDDIQIYSASGSLVLNQHGVSGINTFKSLSSGLYIVRSLGKSFKLML